MKYLLLIFLLTNCATQKPNLCYKSPIDGDTLLIGGSNAHNIHSYMKYDAKITECNAEGTANMLLYMPVWLHHKSYQHVLVFGTFWDIFSQVDAIKYKQNLQKIAQYILAQGMQPVFVLNIQPVDTALNKQVLINNSLMIDVAYEYKLQIIDMYAESTALINLHIDNIHYKEPGNKLLANWMDYQLSYLTK